MKIYETSRETGVSSRLASNTISFPCSDEYEMYHLFSSVYRSSPLCVCFFMENHIYRQNYYTSTKSKKKKIYIWFWKKINEIPFIRQGVKIKFWHKIIIVINKNFQSLSNKISAADITTADITCKKCIFLLQIFCF